MKCSVFFILCLLAAGCVARAPRPPAATAETTTTGPKVTQTGDAAKPAKASTVTQSNSLPIPAGSEVTVSPPQPGQAQTISVKLSAPSVLQTEHRADSVEAPTAFTPPLPPSPEDLAKGESVKYYTWAVIGCVLLAGLFAWRTHYLAAVFSVVAAAILHLMRTDAGLWLAGGAVAVALAFFVAWHITNNREKLPEA